MATNWTEAASLLRQLDVPLDANFHALSSVDVLLIAQTAKQTGYKVRKNAPGSTARMFYQALQQRVGA